MSKDSDLLAAADKADVELILRLINREGADPAAQDSEGKTILHKLAQRGASLAFDKIRDRCQKALPYRTRDRNGNTPLHIAVLYNKPEMCASLLIADPSLILERTIETASSQDCDIDCNAMHLVAMSGNQCAIPLLRSEKAALALQAKNKKGYTPVHCATAENRINLLQEFCRHIPSSLSCSEMEPRTTTPLHLAAELGHNEALKLFTGNIDIVNGVEDTALHIVVRTKNLEGVEILIKKNASSCPVNSTGHRVLHVAAAEGFNSAISFLLSGNPQNAQAAAKVDMLNYKPLCLTIESGNLEGFNLLVQHSEFARKQCTASLARTALIKQQDRFVMPILQVNHTHPDSGALSLLTTLLVSRKEFPLEVGLELVTAGSDLRCKNQDDNSCLHYLLSTPGQEPEQLASLLLTIVATKEKLPAEAMALLDTMESLNLTLKKEIEKYLQQFPVINDDLLQEKILFISTLIVRIASEIYQNPTLSIIEYACEQIRAVIRKTEDEFPMAYNQKSATAQFFGGFVYKKGDRIFSAPDARPSVTAAYCFTYQQICKFQDRLPEYLQQLTEQPAAAAPTP